jgi:hypothetical protein
VNTNMENDLVLFSVVVIIDGIDPEKLPKRLLGIEHQRDSDGLLYFDFGTIEIESNNAAVRQSEFEAASDAFLRALASCGLTARLLKSRNGYARLVISLAPVDGQAGILIAPEMLEKWAPYAPHIAVDA